MEFYSILKKANIENSKPDIHYNEPDIECLKPDINMLKTGFPDTVFLSDSDKISSNTDIEISKLFNEFGYKKLFGRSDVMSLLNIKSSRASELILSLKNMI